MITEYRILVDSYKDQLDKLDDEESEMIKKIVSDIKVSYKIRREVLKTEIDRLKSLEDTAIGDMFKSLNRGFV